MARGARVILIAGPTAVEPPAGVELRRVRSSEEMFQSVSEHVDQADVVVMVAAVADYTPSQGEAAQKISKEKSELTLQLQRTPDIIGAISKRRGSRSRPALVGFAAETTDVVEKARTKLKIKNLDLIVANDLSLPNAGFGVETNAATIVARDSDVPDQVVALGPKRSLARIILTRVSELLAKSGDRPAVNRLEKA